MKIQDIRYSELGGKHGTKLGVRMPGGYVVFKSTLLFAYQKITTNWDKIDWRCVVTAKGIIGVENWGASEQKGRNQALGRCVKFFVAHDMLPHLLEIAKKRNGEDYKGGSVKYVPLGGNAKTAPAISTRRPAKVEETSARNIRITPRSPISAASPL